MEKKEIYIIGGGPSLSNFDFSKLKNKNTIAINKSIFDIPSPTYFITLDYIFLRRIKKRIEFFKSINTSKFFVADFHFPFIQEKNGRIMDVRNDLVYELNDFDVVIKARRAENFGRSFNDFRTGLNSGYCALQLALLLGYEKIYLLGIDLNQSEETHYHGGYGERPGRFKARLPDYFNHFKKALEQLKRTSKNVEVISLSPVSLLNEVIMYQDEKKILCTT